ncbi:MAG: nucleotidyltransferase domain-containing protein [Clostridia bacterium]|nr:nucleotidyltransferase domain-containing protein [Clostridia bacterium]
MKSIKELRNEKRITQNEAAKLCNMSLRSYKMYENEYKDKESIKRDYIISTLQKVGFIDEEHGILTLDEIKKTVSKVLKKYNVDYCILFGSYAKGKAKEKSDVDLLIKTNITGLDYYGLVEELRVKLHKVIDLLNTDQLKNNLKLTEEILQDGIKIYG